MIHRVPRILRARRLSPTSSPDRGRAKENPAGAVALPLSGLDLCGIWAQRPSRLRLSRAVAAAVVISRQRVFDGTAAPKGARLAAKVPRPFIAEKKAQQTTLVRVPSFPFRRVERARPAASFVSSPPVLPAAEGADLRVHAFVQWYVPRHSSRAKEVNFCMRRLLANREITHITLMVPEQDLPQLPVDMRRRPGIGLGIDVVTLARGGRIFFSDAFRRATSDNVMYMVLNSDIVVPERAVVQMRVFLAAAGPARSICLSRYESSLAKVDAQMRWPQDSHVRTGNHCQDVWAFRGGAHITRLSKAAHFALGLCGCDGRIACVLHSVTHVINPCKDVRTYHIHGSNYRTWSTRNKVPGQWAKVPPARLLYTGRSQAHL
jgi:hypothetical protein